MIKRGAPITARCFGLGNCKDGVAIVRVGGGHRWSRLLGKVRNWDWTCWVRDVNEQEMLVGQLGI